MSSHDASGEFKRNDRRRIVAMTILALTALVIAVIMAVGQARLALALGLESDECVRLADGLEAELEASPGRTNSIIRSSKARDIERECQFVSVQDLAEH